VYKRQVVVQLKLLDSISGLVIPAAFGAFGVFLLRQFMLTIPGSLDEAAEIDGADPWTTFWEVTMPLAKSGLTTLAIFTFFATSVRTGSVMASGVWTQSVHNFSTSCSHVGHGCGARSTVHTRPER